MYANVPTHVCVGEEYSEEFKVKVNVHQGWVLSLLLFIIVLEAFVTRVPLWVPLGRLSLPMTLVSLLNRLRNMSGGS